MPEEHKKTYREQALDYDLLVSREDYQQNLIKAIQRIRKVDDLNVIDLGSGTGRVGLLLGNRTAASLALDMSPQMITVASEKFSAGGFRNWSTGVADHRNLPLVNGCADLVISGWSICYLVDWYQKTWQQELEKAFREIHRVLRPGGTIIIIETQGTGFEAPHPPEHLHHYFKYLADIGFEQFWIRTDYRFKDLEEAVNTARFFFGETLAKEVKEKRWVVLPECTGFWYRNLK